MESVGNKGCWKSKKQVIVLEESDGQYYQRSRMSVLDFGCGLLKS